MGDFAKSVWESFNFVIWENAGIIFVAQRQVNGQIQGGGSREVQGTFEKRFSHCSLFVWWKFFWVKGGSCLNGRSSGGGRERSGEDLCSFSQLSYQETVWPQMNHRPGWDSISSSLVSFWFTVVSMSSFALKLYKTMNRKWEWDRKKLWPSKRH